MNLFDEYKKRYIAVCFTIAAIYAFSLGLSMQVFSVGNTSASYDIANILIFCAIDGIVFGGILCLTGILLWNIFRFAFPAKHLPKYRFVFVSTLAVLTCLFVVATETFVIYLCFPSIFGFFVHSIPARLFVTLLLFTIIRIFYIFCIKKHEISGEQADYTQEEKFSKNSISENTKSENDIVANKSKSPTDRITVRSGQKIIIIPIDEIFFIKADGDYISINTDKGCWLKEQTMKYTEDTLPADRFIRIHRSYIVNINYISRIERYGEKQQVVLHNNEKITISAARYQVLKLVLGL